MILGLDTASVAGNGPVDWKAVRAAGYSFALLRASCGRRADKALPGYWEQLREAGIARGAYMFWRVTEDADAQVTVFRRALNAVGGLTMDGPRPDFPPVLDVEFPGDGRRVLGLSAKQALDRARRAVACLREAFGVSPMIYTSARVWLDDLGNLPAPDLADCPLWLAEYTRQNPPPAPAVPPPWAGDDPRDRPLSAKRTSPYTSANWWVHQFKGDANAKTIPGFRKGDVDVNRFQPLRTLDGARGAWTVRHLAGYSTIAGYQEARGLASDGVVGPVTFARLAWERST